jgi:hypothetical protein
MFDALKKPLGGIGKIVVLGQQAALDAVESIDSFYYPMTACFPCPSGMQHSELPICWSVQGSDPQFWPACGEYSSAYKSDLARTDPHLLNYGNSTSTRDKPMSCNSASGTDQISLWWIKRLKKWMMVIMANRSLSATSKRDCVRMTAERTVHLPFRTAIQLQYWALNSRFWRLRGVRVIRRLAPGVKLKTSADTDSRASVHRGDRISLRSAT